MDHSLSLRNLEKFKDLFLFMGCWDLSSLVFNLANFIVNLLNFKYPPPHENSSEDLLLPNFVTHSVFALKLACNTLMHQLLIKNDMSLIWKGRMEPKVNVFVWLLWHDRIPHRNLLAIRGIVPNASDPRCHYPIENATHIIYEWPKSMGIRELADVP